MALLEESDDGRRRLKHGRRSLGGKSKKSTRIERHEQNKNRLFQAAADVVGKHGYAEASIARITERAGLAQGTFYLYFKNRQDLLDQLLPTVGREMIEFVTTAVHGSSDIFEVEERGFRAFFSYVLKHKHFFRILHEAAVAAPKGYERHFKLLSDRYVSSLARATERGQIKSYKAEQLELIGYVLMAARDYIHLRFASASRRQNQIPEWVVETYMDFVRTGLRKLK